MITRESNVRDSAPPTKIKAYYKQNELGGAARARAARAGKVKTCGLSPIYNNIVIIGHREIICPRGSRRETYSRGSRKLCRATVLFADPLAK